MKRITSLLFLTPIFILGVAVQAAEDRGGDDRKKGDKQTQSVTSDPNAPPAHRARPAKAVRPKTIRANPTGGKVNVQNKVNQAIQPTQRSAPAQSPRSQAVRQPDRSLAVGSQTFQAQKRPANTRPYDRQRLSNLGVKTAPKPIPNSSAIFRANRAQSVIRYPQAGPKGESIQASAISPRGFNNNTVRTQMSVVLQPSFNQRLDRERRGENQRNRYYWHSDNGFNYNHYVDNSGYNWYGWYRGDRYFWTRNYNGRWWWYDADYERWCFYQDNNWYWQDPYRQDDFYVYDNDGYISLSIGFNN